MNKPISKSSACHLLAALIFFSVYWCTPCSAENLYVFFPTETRPLSLQWHLKKACPDVDITVFGRYRDLVLKVRQAPPDAIMAKPPVVNSIEGYTVRLKGSRGGSTDESLILLSVGKKIAPETIGGGTVGIIDMLGRKGMKQYVEQFYSPAPKLKRVTKIEDLLPLLTFEMADAVIISENHVRYFQTFSRLKFVIQPLSDVKTGIICLAVREGIGAGLILQAVKGLKKGENALLEVDGWKQDDTIN